MELNPDEVAEQLGVLIEAFVEAANLHLPIPINMDGLADQIESAPQAALKLHSLLAAQPLEEEVALVAHGFVDAWMALTVVSHQMLGNPHAEVQEAAHSSYFWLCGQAIASIEFLKSRANGA